MAGRRSRPRRVSPLAPRLARGSRQKVSGGRQGQPQPRLSARANPQRASSTSPHQPKTPCRQRPASTALERTAGLVLEPVGPLRQEAPGCTTRSPGAVGRQLTQRVLVKGRHLGATAQFPDPLATLRSGACWRRSCSRQGLSVKCLIYRTGAELSAGERHARSLRQCSNSAGRLGLTHRPPYIGPHPPLRRPHVNDTTAGHARTLADFL